MASWIVPTLGYIVFVGAAGVTAKLALRTITWQQLVLWVPIVYICFAAGLVAFGGARLPFGVGGGWALATAICAAAGLILLFVALSHGSAGKVVPATSAYPVVTLIGAALFLSERITVARGIGTALVIVGVAIISR